LCFETQCLFQFIAQKLLDINESGKFKDPSLLDDKERKTQDDEIFHRTRLINCGYFMRIILGGNFSICSKQRARLIRTQTMLVPFSVLFGMGMTGDLTLSW